VAARLLDGALDFFRHDLAAVRTDEGVKLWQGRRQLSDRLDELHRPLALRALVPGMFAFVSVRGHQLALSPTHIDPVNGGLGRL
jgi:hypothetical protein